MRTNTPVPFTPPSPSAAVATLLVAWMLPALANAADSTRHELRSPDGTLVLTLQAGAETR